MNKYLSLLITILFIFLSCNSSNSVNSILKNNNQDVSLQQHSVFLNYAGIRSAETVFLSGFEFIYEYSLRDDGYGDDLVIWAVNEPLAGFEFLEITDKYDYNEYETYFVPGDVLFSLDVLPIGHALVIRNFAGRGIFPNLAISFIDTNGLRRYAGFMHDLSENEKYLFIEFALDNGVPPFALPPWNWDRE